MKRLPTTLCLFIAACMLVWAIGATTDHLAANAALAQTTPLAGDRDPYTALDVSLRRIPPAMNSQEANGESLIPQMSANGRYIIFHSDANNLVPNDTNNATDVFLYDRETVSVERISLTASGAQAVSDSCCHSDISGDGRYVVFASGSPDMDDVAGQNGWTDVFLRDRQTGTLTQISHAFDGTAANNGSFSPSISVDGQHIVFQSYASNLVTNDTNNTVDLFVYAVATQTIHLVSVALDGNSGNGASILSYNDAVSDDGRFIVFYSLASNLVTNDTNLAYDVFVRDRDADGDGILDETGPGEVSTQLVSVTPGGAAGDGNSNAPFITGNGRFILFASLASDLVPGGDTNTEYDLFLRDMTSGVTEIVSLLSDGTQAQGTSSYGAVSEDGRFVVIQSGAELTGLEPDMFYDIFLRDRQTGVNTLLSQSAGDGRLISGYPDISADGLTIVFQSASRDLVPNDTNNVTDLFLYEVDPNFHLYLPMVQR
ncbi:MAG: hypothetical protein H6652_07395 [Ardenticatenaceae bacterium]|nr:hypothetical protein [Ardenticatenaceae bacterium]